MRACCEEFPRSHFGLVKRHLSASPFRDGFFLDFFLWGPLALGTFVLGNQRLCSAITLISSLLLPVLPCSRFFHSLGSLL